MFTRITHEGAVPVQIFLVVVKDERIGVVRVAGHLVLAGGGVVEQGVAGDDGVGRFGYADSGEETIVAS